MIKKILVLGCLLFTAGVASAEPPSDASIHQLLAVTEVRQLLDGIFPQMEQVMNSSMKQALGGREMTADEEKAMKGMSTRMIKIMREELNWENLEALYINVYRESFTQEEVDGMLAFYKTPAGAAVIKKMPLVMKKSMTAMQQRMGPLMEKVQTAVQETVEEINAAHAGKEGDKEK